MSPARISTIASPSLCAQLTPLVTTTVWPTGFIFQGVRAPGPKVANAPESRLGPPRWK